MIKRASNRPSPRHPARPARRRWLWASAALVGLVAVAAAVSFWPRAGGVAPLSAARLARDPSLGLASAPITLVEYGDFG